MITLLLGVILVLVIVYLIARMGPQEKALVQGVLPVAWQVTRALLLTLLTAVSLGWLVIVLTLANGVP